MLPTHTINIPSHQIPLPTHIHIRQASEQLDELATMKQNLLSLIRVCVSDNDNNVNNNNVNNDNNSNEMIIRRISIFSPSTTIVEAAEKQETETETVTVTEAEALPLASSPHSDGHSLIMEPPYFPSSQPRLIACARFAQLAHVELAMLRLEGTPTCLLTHPPTHPINTVLIPTTTLYQ